MTFPASPGKAPDRPPFPPRLWTLRIHVVHTRIAVSLIAHTPRMNTCWRGQPRGEFQEQCFLKNTIAILYIFTI